MMFFLRTSISQEPVEVKVGPAYYASQFSGSKQRKVLKSDTFLYIPVEQTLCNLLQLSPVTTEIKTFMVQIMTP